jgi:glycosyltransferase involved in cell wall biosynthesis
MKNRSRIQVLMLYYEPFPSGQTAHVHSLVEGLDPTRFQVQVILPDHLSSEQKYFKSAGACVRLAPIRKVFWKPAALAKLARTIRSNKDLIIHIHSQEAGLIGRPLAKVFGAGAILYTPQTIDIRRKQYQELYSVVERGLAGITDRIISVNEADKRRLVNWGIPESKVEMIYNSIDLRKFTLPAKPAGLRQKMAVDHDCPVIMQIGRLSMQKAPLNFIKGAAIILSKRPNAKFVMVGDGPLGKCVQQLVAGLHLQEKILLLGSCREAYNLIPDADIITLTSIWEGAPYSLLEAMGWAKPVVATSVNGCPEIVSDGDTGLLVPPNNPDAWARAVMQLIDDPIAAASMGLEGRHKVEEKFNLPIMIRRIEAIYGNLCID